MSGGSTLQSVASSAAKPGIVAAAPVVTIDAAAPKEPVVAKESALDTDAASAPVAKPAKVPEKPADEAEERPRVVPPAVLAGGGSADVIPLETLAAIKAATVYIKIEAGPLVGSGSGFLMRTMGDSGLIVTNHHVVNPPTTQEIRTGRIVRRITSTAKPKITAIFRSGTPHEKSAPATVVASDKDADLAVIKVSGVKDLPQPIDTSQELKLVETMPVFIFGFPYGEALAMKKGNPAITVGKGSVSSVRQNERGEVVGVQIDGNINPGNSGGPVVDYQGRLVGVSVATIKGSGIGLAIPPVDLAHMLQGRLGGAALLKVKRDQEAADLQGEIWLFDRQNKVKSTQAFSQRLPLNSLPKAQRGNGPPERVLEARLIDPLNKIQKVSVFYLKGIVAPPQAAPDASGSWNPVVGARRLDLQIDDQEATAALDLVIPDKGNDPFTFQLSYESGDGKTIYTQPRTFNPNAVSPPIIVQPGNPRPAPDPRANSKPITADDLDQALADLESTDAGKRRTMADRLARSRPVEGKEGVAKALEGLLSDPDGFTRQAGARALGVWGGKENVMALLEVINHDDVFTRRVVIETLGKLKDERAAEPLAQRLTDGFDRATASRALQALGKSAEKPVIKRLQSSDWTVQAEACKILQVVGTKTSIPALKNALLDRNAFVRNAAADALRAIMAKKS
jgi:S1-C subfamily serine protease